jgi:hypothetical protein
MSKKTLHSVVAVWLILVLFSLWKETLILQIITSAMSLMLGTLVLVSDPRSDESKRIGYRPIGLALLLVGVGIAMLALYEKFMLSQP